jgi:uncharacterized membrane protein
MKLRKLPGLRVVFARPRLLFSIAFGIAVWVVLPLAMQQQPSARALIAWNAAALLYLVLAMIMMARSPVRHVRWRARIQDEGKYAVLALVVCSSTATLFAIAVELSTAKDFHGAVKVGHVALAALTVFTSWAVTQTMFALHYAHDYYRMSAQKDPGMQFPGAESPDYFDFLYAACIIGTSGQTADVSFSNRTLRRLALIQSVLAFFFNTILLALTINIAAGLI